MGRERPRIYFWIGRLLAGLLHYVPDILLRLQSRVASAVDHDMLRDADTRAVLQQSGREAFVQKGCGPASDLGIYAENWGFHLQEIRLPGILWQGLADITTPPEIARELAASLPLCRLRLIPEEGHFSLVIRRMHTILADFTAGRNDSFKIESSAG
jgi:pimeloyl-ACP methyl ester carboxylesterase